MKWFKHHTDAHTDARLRKLTIRYGAEGYALYWYCLELIAGKVCAENLTFELEHDAELIAHELRVDSFRVQEIMSFMVNMGLFEESENRITCLKIAKHLDERFARTEDLKKIILEAKGGKGAARLPRVLPPSEDAGKTVLPGAATIEGSRAEQSRAEQSKTPDGVGGPQAAPPCPYSAIADLYHEHLCPPCSRILVLSEKRKDSIRARWRNELPDLDQWRGYFLRVAASPFLTGRVSGRNGQRPFMADIDFLIRPDTCIKVAEGKYDGDSNGQAVRR